MKRLLIGGTGSGCGKTTVVCALLQAIKNRGMDVGAFKCGPDYIDPMFHSEVIGLPSFNVDLFFAGENIARALFMKHARAVNIIEGVMGYYDGMTMDDDPGSANHVSRVLEAPGILVVNGRGMGLSAAAIVKGYLSFRKNNIRGVIFNHVTAMTYPRLKEAVERECGIRAYGFLPECKEAALESRHLGLVTAEEVENLQEKLTILAKKAEECIDIDGLLELAETEPISTETLKYKPIANVRIAVARDRAFCFYYRDNLEMLEEMGARLIPFSPINDRELPECDGLYIGGGYPELHAKALSENTSLLQNIREAILGGLPTVAECGGFMYLNEKIGEYAVAGVIPGSCENTGKLRRFGYITLNAQENSLLFKKGETIRAHEFHYWDAQTPGDALTAIKPNGRSWKCAHTSSSLYAGYPHLYFPSCPDAAARFITACAERKKRT